MLTKKKALAQIAELQARLNAQGGETRKALRLRVTRLAKEKDEAILQSNINLQKISEANSHLEELRKQVRIAREVMNEETRIQFEIHLEEAA